MKETRSIVWLALMAVLCLGTGAATAAHSAASTISSGSEIVSPAEAAPGLVRRAAVATSADRALPSAASTPRDLEAAFSTAEPLSLTGGDFDEDGMPDLAAAYSTAAGGLGLIAVWRGNVDAVYGWTPEARARRAAGTFTEAPFLGPPALFALPEPADFLAAGDFDGDGRKDLAAAALGGDAVYLLPGDGRGALAPAAAIPLSGRITAWASGEVNRRDGLEDLVVAIDGDDGPKLVVFEGPNGALAWEPEVVSLAEPAEDLALGELDGDFWVDVAVSGTSGVTIVHGRDRRLSVSAAARAAVHSPKVTGAGESLEKDIEAAVAEAFSRQNPLSGGPSGPERAAAGGAVAGLEMRLDPDGFADLVLLEEGGVEPTVVVNATGTTWTVNTTADTTDGSCDPLGSGSGNQDCTFREALTVAGSGDSIHFSIPCATPPICPAFPPVISPGSALPEVSQGVTINGTTQSQGSIVLNGVNVGSVPGLRVTGNDTVVGGLRIGNFGGYGIRLEASGNRVEQCLVGLSGLGLSAPNDEGGVSIGVGDNTVGCTAVTPCNVISANGGPGVQIDGGASRNNNVLAVIIGNFIGTNSGGTSALPNERGIDILTTSQTQIGSPDAGARNVISGNAGVGIRVVDAELANIAGNYIGTDASGTTALGNGAGGVEILEEATSNTVGGTVDSVRNVISGNTGAGVTVGNSLGGLGNDNNLIQGNYIGTNQGGSAALGNTQYGILYTEIPNTNDAIGGAASGAGNLISGNGQHGILFEANQPIQGMSVLRNRIGTDAAGTGDLGNGDAGIAFKLDGNPVFSIPIGDGTAANANRIAFNRCGVLVVSGTRWPVRGNEIFANERLGISLLDPGLTPDCLSDRVTMNDEDDKDFGLQNFPVLSSVNTSGGTTTIVGTYSGALTSVLDIDFYSSLACDSSGFGEGEEYLGSTMAITNGSGNAVFSFQPGAPVTAGRWVTATVTNSVTGSTSEFSACRREDATCGAPENLVIEGGSIDYPQTFEACQTITAAGNEADPLTVEGVGVLTLRAGESVAILDGFIVEGGLEIAIDPALAP